MTRPTSNAVRFHHPDDDDVGEDDDDDVADDEDVADDGIDVCVRALVLVLARGKELCLLL